jgi:hypothetical protein
MSSPTSNVLQLVATGPGKRRKTRKQTAKYNYPKIHLRQSYFCRSHGGHGEWHDPVFSFRMLGCKNFVSQIGALLDELEADGHHVKGPRIEWLALRDLAHHYQELFFNMAITPIESTVASHLYQSSDR